MAVNEDNFDLSISRRFYAAADPAGGAEAAKTGAQDYDFSAVTVHIYLLF